MRELLLLLLLLACPLAMVLMMRGGHGHGRHGHGRTRPGSDHTLGEAVGDGAIVSTEELRSRRDELDRLIADREERRERQESGAER